jgi:hypothetical protein
MIVLRNKTYSFEERKYALIPKDKTQKAIERIRELVKKKILTIPERPWNSVVALPY